MVDFKKDTWIYILIAAILIIIGLFSPILASDGDAYVWWGASITYFPDPDIWFGAGAATLWTFGMAAFSAALLLWYGLHNMKGMEFKWDWLVYAVVGIILIIFPILMLVYDEPPTGFDPFIGPIFVLIGGIIVVVAFILEKFLGE